MVRFWLACIFCLATATSLSAQEKVIDHYVVTLGIISWENIRAGINVKTTPLSAYQYRMAIEMAKMHSGGEMGDYHVLVVIDDKASGQQVKDAEIEIVVSSQGFSSKTATLERMDMEGFAGYGGYIGFNFEKPYTMLISFKLPSAREVKQVEFSTLP